MQLHLFILKIIIKQVFNQKIDKNDKQKKRNKEIEFNMQKQLLRKQKTKLNRVQFLSSNAKIAFIKQKLVIITLLIFCYYDLKYYFQI